jgi:hypothetical protein
MGFLDQLTTPTGGASITNSTASQQVMPDWYNQYVQGLAQKATQAANVGYTPYTAPRLAGFSPDQLAAQQTIEQSQGAWKPQLDAANSVLSTNMGNVDARLGAGANYGSGAVSGAGAANTAANSAVAGPAQNWTQNYKQYMSPYTDQVVNEIGRLGNQNLMENLLPQVQSSFLGSGQFGSTRNADILGQTIRGAQQNISGQQAGALEQGYGTSANIFGNDANRAQQQQSLQAQTALGGGNLVSNSNLGAGGLANQAAQIGSQAALGTAGALGNLAGLGSNLIGTDAQRLSAVGGQQQQQQQAGLDVNYQDFLNQQNYNKNNVGFLNQALGGMQIPTGQVNLMNQTGVGTNPLQYIGALSGLNSYSPTPPVQKNPAPAGT